LNFMYRTVVFMPCEHAGRWPVINTESGGVPLAQTTRDGGFIAPIALIYQGELIFVARQTLMTLFQRTVCHILLQTKHSSQNSLLFYRWLSLRLKSLERVAL